MSLRIGDLAPDFTAESTQGRINFDRWLGNAWCLVLSHPRHFTPVCTTELGYLARMQRAFAERNCKVLSLSIDPVEDLRAWHSDIRDITNYDVRYPLVGDRDLSIARLYDMLPAAAVEAISTLYIIGPDKLIEAALMYPMSSGRNFDEVLRLLDACQLAAGYKVASPMNWMLGDGVIVVRTLLDDEVRERLVAWKGPQPYMRLVAQPGSRTDSRR